KHINQYWGVVEVAKGAGWGDCDPTQELVDDFEFTDGKTAAQGSTVYDPAHPYTGREKRFYSSIIYDGSVWRGETIYTRKGIANNANEINTTGKSGNTGRSGYFVKKILDSTIGSVPGNLDGTNFIVWRYAEVLLNYAEAQNEDAGPDQSVYDAVNKVRERAGQPDLPAGLSQADMRTRIRHERRIELAFEGKRFYDLMRWKTAQAVFSQPIHGMQVSGTGNNLTYQVITIRNITFDPTKNYLQPIPQTVLDQNPKLTQNPNY
ncbi:MAG TPA: RagB/SusD family nutrient uptake outer membrane protein, partial [Puia sp.]|nr:RagB/SusD family nutrient uptake outer membrane protein [Puia sp.]